jgi:ribose transport system ATP-binding protein
MSNLLEIRNIVWKNRIRDVSLSIREGEIVGLYGLMGSGRTELANLIFGIEKKDSGEILYRSKCVQNSSPETSIKNRMAYITEDRRHEGLMMTKSVNMNLGLVKLKEVLNRIGMVNNIKMKSLTTKSIEDLRIKVTHPATQMANNLSGGNQQKVVFGKWVMMTPEIFILDEPTRGVDVGAKYEIYSIAMNLAKMGSGVLFISSEMEELLGVCDRILVMKEGRISGEVEKPHFDQEIILKLALVGERV